MVTIKQKIGRSMVEAQNKDLKEACEIAELLGSIPPTCSCGSDDIHLSYKSPKGNDYYGVKCRTCGAELMFHQKKEGGFYLKWDDKFEKFQGNKESGGAEQKTREVMGADNFESDTIPF